MIEADIHIHGKLYYADLKNTKFKVNDLVLDLGDGTFAWIEKIQGKTCVLREGFVVELNVPLSRLVKLVPVEG